jgi:ABC-2 type transport system permease protein
MIFIEIARLTLRALLGRRRTVLMVLLAAIPILVALLVRANQGGVDEVGPILDGLVVRIILPLVRSAPSWRTVPRSTS